MSLDFVTAANTDNKVRFGTSENALTTNVTATAKSFTGNGWTGIMNAALLTGLAPLTKYYYIVGNDKEGWSQLESFVNAPKRAGGDVYAILADFGYLNDESLPLLIEDSIQGGFDVLVHAGDFAYDLDTENSSIGNAFFNALQPVVATVPYMASPGNHEAYQTQLGGNFTQFVARFGAIEKYAGANSGSNSNLWYSFDSGLAHWLVDRPPHEWICAYAQAHSPPFPPLPCRIAFTSETWTMSPSQITTQLAWLKADLAKANANRAAVPWVLAYSHKNFDHDQVCKQCQLPLPPPSHLHTSPSPPPSAYFYSFFLGRLELHWHRGRTPPRWRGRLLLRALARVFSLLSRHLSRGCRARGQRRHVG